MIPSPRVMVRNSLRKPTRPRAGMRKVSRVRPLPRAVMSIIRPFRGPSRSVTTPTADSGTSQTISSIGSVKLPVDLLGMGSGLRLAVSS